MEMPKEKLQEMKKLDGKVALVTGGGRGIGRGIVLSLARAGADVAIADIVLESAQDVVREAQMLSRKAVAIKVDVTKLDQVESMVSETVSQLGRLDIAVNNAGVLGIAPLSLLTEEEWDRLFNVNVKGVFLCTKIELAYMQGKCSGKIINISSSAGKMGVPMLSHYCATKFAVLGFTNSVAKEVATSGITVNAICPGILGTDMWLGPKGLAMAFKLPHESMEESFQRNLATFIPQGVPQTPEDIGEAVVFLAGADHITGQAISVDGGINNP